MRVVVTGGLGFIGSNFVLHTLRHEGCVGELVVVDKRTYAANPATEREIERSGVRVIEADICDEEAMTAALHGADLVVHFAAESHNDNSLKNPLAFLRTNVEGTAVLAGIAAREGIRFHHISTDEVFGDLPLDSHEYFHPDTPYNPSSPYSASKAAADHVVRAYVRSFGLRATISNCSNNYGPRQHPEKFIPRQIINLLQGKPAKIYGDGRNIRDWIHVDDHNAALWSIITRGTIGKTYLIGAHGEASNKDIVQMLITQLDDLALAPIPEKHRVEWVRDRPGHDRRYAIDPTSTEALGWKPAHTNLAEGLRETVQWYADHPQWWAEAWKLSEQKYAAEHH